MEITSGTIQSAQKVLVYGPEGIGKSTFAAQFPNALFIDTEGSTKHLDVRRLPNPESWTMLLEEVRFVSTDPSSCSTLVIDTADWAEGLCVHHICATNQKSGIEDFGYGKGYTYLAEEFGKLLNLLSDVVDRGVNVVLTAHAQIKKFEQPDEMAAYDRWELKLQKKTAPLVKEWCDMVLFANYETFAVKDDKSGAVKGQGGKRVLHTSHAPAWDAKNRSGLADKLPFEFAAIAKAIPVMNGPKAAEKPAAKAKEAKAASDKAPEIEGVNTEQPVEQPKQQSGGATQHTTLHMVQLQQLMESNGVSEGDIRRAVAARGFFPESTPIEKYPADFVEGVLITAWPKVMTFINESRQASLDDVPFK